MTRRSTTEDPILTLIGHLWTRDHPREAIAAEIAATFAVVLTLDQISTRAGKAGFQRSPRYRNGPLAQREARVWDRVSTRPVGPPEDNAVRKSGERFRTEGGYRLGVGG